jgi:hypothetical protein
MALIQSGVSGATLMTVDPTYAAARVAIRPVEQLGTYAVGAFTGAYTGAGANTPLFSMRFVAGSAGSAQIAMIQRVTMSFVQTTAFTTAQQMGFGLLVARSFTGSDAGGTQIVVSGNNQKFRTSMQTSQIATNGDMRISSTAALTAGTRTLDSQAVSVAHGWGGSVLLTTGMYQPQQITLYENFPGDTPLILQSNEGIVINNIVAMGAGGVFTVAVNVEWTESSTAASTSY